MTSSKLVSVKVPERLLQRMPAAGEGRSRFIIAALEEKLATATRWEPSTARGRRMAVLLEKGRQERAPLLDAKQIEEELAERRGRLH